MALSSSDPNETPDDLASSQAGSVYYRQKKAPRQRHASPMDKVQAAPTKTRQRPTSNLGHAILLANIRTFSLVALFMFTLLGLAVYITGRIWTRNEAQSKKGAPSALRAAPRPALTGTEGLPDAPSAGIMLEGRRSASLPNVRIELDTEAMSRAIFMAKRAEALAASGNEQEAIDRYQDALEIWPYLTQVWAQLGRVYLSQRDFGRAQIALERAVENDPANADVLNDLGVALLYQNRLDQALDIFSTVNDINPSFAPAHFNRALCYLSKQDSAAAERSLDLFLRLQPNDARALKERAYLKASDGHYEEALTLLLTALSTTPDWAPLFFDAAAAAALLGRVEETIRYLDKAEALTTPGIVYRMYQQPAFREIRLTEPGHLFEVNLAERAREEMALPADEEKPLAITEPIHSVPAKP